MRFKNLPAGVLFALTLSFVGLQPANAQSFLETLFGFSKPAPRFTPAPNSRSKTPRGRVGSSGARTYLYESQRWQSKSRFSGSYKTVCVRTCDGFFFPISSGTTRNKFHDDARECKRRCGTQTAMFYMSRYEDDIRAARNLAGGSYEDLENAFKYRKSLVNGCSCRPMPWSAAERARHNRYKVLAAVKKSYALAEVRTRQQREVNELIRKVHAAKKESARALAIIDPYPKESKTIAGAKLETLGRPEGYSSHAVAIDIDTYDRDMWLAAIQRYAAPLHPGRNELGSQHFADADPQLGARPPSGEYDLADTRSSVEQQRAQAQRKKSRARKYRTKPKSVFSGLFAQQKTSHRWPGD